MHRSSKAIVQTNRFSKYEKTGVLPCKDMLLLSLKVKETLQAPVSEKLKLIYKIQINVVHFLIMLRLDPGGNSEQVPRFVVSFFDCHFLKGVLHEIAGLAYELVLT